MGILEFGTSYGSVWTIYQGNQEVLGVPLKEVSGEKCVLTRKNQVFFMNMGKTCFPFGTIYGWKWKVWGGDWPKPGKGWVRRVFLFSPEFGCSYFFEWEWVFFVFVG